MDLDTYKSYDKENTQHRMYYLVLCGHFQLNRQCIVVETFLNVMYYLGCSRPNNLSYNEFHVCMHRQEAEVSEEYGQNKDVTEQKEGKSKPLSENKFPFVKWKLQIVCSIPPQIHMIYHSIFNWASTEFCISFMF